MRLISLLLIFTFTLVGCDSGGADSGSDSGAETTVSNDGTTPESAPDTDFQDEMLVAVNAARAVKQDCGGTIMPAVPMLKWDIQLEQAAYTHSIDMANYDFFSHTGSDGSSVSTRVTAQGYTWSAVGENIAAGQKDVEAVMTSWINSPGHCKNMMSANFTQIGASFVTNSSTQYAIYWTQVFAKPRS